MKTTLVIVELNELEGMKTFVPQINKDWYDQIIVLVGQPMLDNSLEWCKEKNIQTFIGERDVWNGYRNLFLSGLIEGEIVITTSPDGNSPPIFIPVIKEKLEQGYDMVIASRYLPPAISLDDTVLTKIGNKVLTGLINLRSYYHYTDALVIYRGYRTEIIKKLGFTEELNNFQWFLTGCSNLYGWESSMSIRAGRAGLNIAEIPASEPKSYRERRQNTFGHGFVIISQILQEEFFRK